jgi:hypothetical protein
MECAGKVWYVHGDPDKVLLALRSDAEAWVKLAFPAEDTVKQAGRIRSSMGTRTREYSKDCIEGGA